MFNLLFMGKNLKQIFNCVADPRRFKQNGYIFLKGGYYLTGKLAEVF